MKDNYLNSETTYCYHGCIENASSSKYCKDLTLAKDSYKHCCYLKGKMDDVDVNTCVPLTKDQYKNIKKTIKEFEEEDGNNVKKLV